MWDALVKFILSFFKEPSSSTGVLPDTRSQEDKDKDYTSAERLTAGVPDPFGNEQIIESPYPYENQNRTFSCVAHSAGLALAIERKMDQGTYTRIAPIFDYKFRTNFPAEGSYPQNIFDIYRLKGSPLYTSMPTPYSEVEANSVVITGQLLNEAAIFKGLNYFTVNNYSNINTLATIAMQGHAISILVYGMQDEWGLEYPTIEVPNLQLTTTTEIRHCVTVLPYSGFTLNGKKYITIQDSAWFGGKKIRHLSEDWVSKRVYGATYWDTVAIEGGGTKPLYTFARTLSVGSTGADVKALQQLLVYEQMLPSDATTGYFGGLTMAGVKAFQTKYASEILAPVGLTVPSGIFGPQSIKKANSITSG